MKNGVAVDFRKLSALARAAKDVSGLRAVLSTCAPHIWEHPAGEDVLRYLAKDAAAAGDRVRVGVPINNGLRVCTDALCAKYNGCSVYRWDTQFTPLVAAVANLHKDVALELLALPGQEVLDLDLEWDLGKGATLLMYAAKRGQTRLPQEFLFQHNVELVARMTDGHTALCVTVCYLQPDAMNVLLEEYQARGRLQEALDCRCISSDGSLFPLSRHHTAHNCGVPYPAGKAAELTILRELVSRWALTPAPTYLTKRKVIILHCTPPPPAETCSS